MRFIGRVCTPLFLLCIIAAAPHAGGGAIITMDHVPDYLVVGEPVTLSWVARQHGEFVALNYHGLAVVNGEKVTVERYGGQFSAKYTPKEAGPVQVSVQIIMSARAGSGASQRVATVISGRLDLLQIQAVDPGEAPPALAPAERGRRLFVAKGCATCHQHNALARSGHGIDLTGRSYGINYLADLLNDPYSVLPARNSPYGGMPALGLSYADAEAIGAFLREAARR